MKNPLLAPELREALQQRDPRPFQELAANVNPGLVAEFFSALEPDEVAQALALIPTEYRAEIFAHVDDGLQVDVAERLSRQELARLISAMPPDDRVDLLKRMPDERVDVLLPALAQAERDDIRRLCSYAEGTAGAVMTSEYATLPADITAAEAITRLRQVAPDKETIYYAYVVDAHRRLLGFVSLKDLILAPPNRRVEDMMHTDPIFARVDDDQEDAARKIQRYDLIALPVLDASNTLVGIITYDDAVDIITQEQTEDVEKLMAIGGEHEAAAYMRTPAWTHFRNRCVWIVVLAGLGLVSGYIVQSFEGLILQFAILATFMPMLADTGGNTGSQAATLVVRALALKEIELRDVLRVLWKEFRVAILLALVLVVVAAVRVWLYSLSGTIPPDYSLTQVGIAVSLALGLQVVSSTLIGAILPLAAAAFRFDPAVVASPALTTIVDITGLLIFFFTVKMVLGL